MDNKLDVERELQEKNKAILFNKLNYDIDNNQEILGITLKNILHKLFQELSSKLLEIEATDDNDYSQKLVVTFQEKLQVIIDSVLKNRSNRLREEIEKGNNDYHVVLEHETEIIIAKIKEVYEEGIIEIKKLGERCSLFNKERLNAYLDVLFLEKLIVNIEQALHNANIILCNNQLESMEKYEKLNSIKVR